MFVRVWGGIKVPSTLKLNECMKMDKCMGQMLKSVILGPLTKQKGAKYFLCFPITLTLSIFELEKNFFQNRSEFHQKLIGNVFSELQRQKCVKSRQN